MILADNHCHISKEYFEDPIEEIASLSRGSNLEYIAVMGVDSENNEEYLVYKEKFLSGFLKIGLGLHPSEVIKQGERSIMEYFKVKEQIEKNNKKIDFIGEIGIDFTYPNAEKFRSEQVEIFGNFCRFGKEMNIPLSVHCREAWDEITEVIEGINFDSSNFNGFIHCFTGNFEQGVFFIENGFKLGINGIITFKKSDELRNTLSELRKFYSDRTFDEIFGIETDTPYLSPEPVRSEKNSPRNIKIIADYIKNTMGE